LSLRSIRPPTICVRTALIFFPTATLDGGSSVYDGGYSITDQTLKATIRQPSKATLISLQYLVAYYSQIILSCEVGVFSAIPTFALNKISLSLSLRLTGRLDT
jgi:hypothetical protein